MAKTVTYICDLCEADYPEYEINRVKVTISNYGSPGQMSYEYDLCTKHTDRFAKIMEEQALENVDA